MNILPLNMIKIFFKEIITFIPFVLILHKFLQNDSYKMNNLNSDFEKMKLNWFALISGRQPFQDGSVWRCDNFYD